MRYIPWSLWTLLAVSLLSGPGLSPVLGQLNPTNYVAVADFESGVPWSYGYFYTSGWPHPGPSPQGSWTCDTEFLDAFIAPSNGPTAFIYWFTNGPLLDLMTNSGALYGTGFGAPLIWAGSLDGSLRWLSGYFFEFDVRLAGLLPGVTAANCQVQCQWFSANGRIFQNNFDVHPGSNWTHYTFALSESIGNEGSLSNWTFCVSNHLITELHFTVNLHRPDLQFGWDNYNQVVVDNLKLRQDHCDCPPPVLPTVARAIADWNMDDKPLDGYSCYDWASDERRVRVNCGTNTSVAGGVGGSVGWWLSMDNSPLAPPNTPLWAGCATYGSGPVNWRLFDTNSLAAYRISFDARVEGLASNTLATNCELHLLLNSPRGNLRLAFPVPATTNWAQTAWVLQSGTASSGSKSSFATNYNTYTELVMGLQIDQAVSSEWGYDGDNLLVVDNLKLERLYIACPPLTLTLTNNFAVVSWPPASSGTTELQTAINPAGPFAGIPGATNPCIVPLNGQPKYFRTRWLPPSGGNF